MHRLFLLAAFGCIICQGGELGCIDEITLPKYDSFVSRIPGLTIRITIRIGPGGRAKSIKCEYPNQTFPKGTKSHLSDVMKQYLMDETRYSPSCQGRDLGLVFSYSEEGEPSDDPNYFVRFHPPDHFFFVSRPGKPNLYHGPAHLH
jgi:hypothetical protein